MKDLIRPGLAKISSVNWIRRTPEQITRNITTAEELRNQGKTVADAWSKDLGYSRKTPAPIRKEVRSGCCGQHHPRRTP